jgi:hypothetical protein
LNDGSMKMIHSETKDWGFTVHHFPENDDTFVTMKEWWRSILRLYHKVHQSFHVFVLKLLKICNEVNSSQSFVFHTEDPKYSLVKLVPVLYNDRFNHISKPATNVNNKMCKSHHHFHYVHRVCDNLTFIIQQREVGSQISEGLNTEKISWH